MKYKILIVDDDSERMKSLAALLEDADYGVETAGASVLRKIATREVPDLVILYPKFNRKGGQTSRLVRTAAKWRTIPILLFGTLEETDAAVVEELNGGANAYLRIPFKPVQLATLTARLIEHEKMEKIVHKKDFRFLSLIENSSDLITVMSLDGTIHYESPSAERILGRKPLTHKSVNAFDFIHPEDRRRVKFYIKKSVAEPPLSVAIEYRYRHHNGSWCYLESVGRKVEDPTKGKVIVVNSREISARKNSENALSESEEKFKAQYKNIPIPTYTWRKTAGDLVFIECNDAAREVTHWKADDLIGKNASAIYDHAPDVIFNLNKCFDERKSHSQNTLYTYRTTGETRNLEINYVYVPPDLVMAHTRDVTDSLKSAEYLAASEKRFKLAARATNDALWDRDLITDEIWLNDSFYDTFGYRRKEFKSEFEIWKKNLHPEDRERVIENLKDCIDEGKSSWSEEYRYRRNDGTYADIYDRGYLMRDENGKPLRMIGAMMDVTERKSAENAVRFQALLLDTVQQAVIFTDLNGKINYWNSYAEKIFEWTAAEASNQNALDLILPKAARQQAEEVLTKLLQSKNWTGEILLQKRDGTRFPVQIVSSPVHNEFGQRIGMLGILSDITERKLAEKENLSLNTEIQTQRQRLNAIIANIPGVVWEAGLISDKSDRLVDFVSDYVEKMIGYTVEDWMSQPNFWLRIIHPEDRQHVELELNSFLETRGKSVQQYRWIAKDGRTVWVETQMVLVADENGEPFSLRGISIDVSERRLVEEALQKSEEQLRQSQKLESVGRLAGGIAHDFNNMLTAINGYSDLILRELGDDDSLRRKVLEIKKAGERSAALTHQLLAFSRRQVLQPKLIDLNKTINEMNQMLFRLIGEDIQLNIALSSQSSRVEADPGQLSQVILNLVVNARDAMPQGGELIIKTELVRFEKEPVAQFSPQTKATFVKLSVIDTGIGIEDKIFEQIFEPFFTTKAVGAGTGLGLSTVYGIIKQSGGYIWVDSEPGEGAAFNIYLPYVEEKVSENKERKPSEQFPHGTETILLVEDEEMVRNLTRRILEVCGYAVIEARNGIEALKYCEETGFKIDLLMTDVVMPQMDGRELSEKVAAVNPKIQTLFTSGYMNDRIMRLGVSGDAINFIQKPFAPDVLARKVREMLDMDD